MDNYYKLSLSKRELSPLSEMLALPNVGAGTGDVCWAAVVKVVVVAVVAVVAAVV